MPLYAWRVTFSGEDRGWWFVAETASIALGKAVEFSKSFIQKSDREVVCLIREHTVEK